MSSASSLSPVMPYATRTTIPYSRRYQSSKSTPGSDMTSPSITPDQAGTLRGYERFDGSGRQPLDDPAALGIPRVSEPVVETVLAALPELEGLRGQPHPAPERRQGNLAALELGLQSLVALLQVITVGDGLALAGGPRGQSGLARARVEVALRILGGGPADGPGRPDLAVQRRPVQGQGGPRVRRQLPRLAALVVREEQESLSAEPLQQDHPDRGLAGRVDRGQGHGVGPDGLAAERLGPPSFELDERVRIEIAPVEFVSRALRLPATHRPGRSACGAMISSSSSREDQSSPSSSFAERLMISAASSMRSRWVRWLTMQARMVNRPSTMVLDRNTRRDEMIRSKSRRLKSSGSPREGRNRNATTVSFRSQRSSKPGTA